MTIKYPNALDTDAELPSIIDGASEFSSDAINAMRDSIFAIERALGTNPNGATATLVARLAESLNDDGTIKATALLAAGLISLPITNGQIAAS